MRESIYKNMKLFDIQISHSMHPDYEIFRNYLWIDIYSFQWRKHYTLPHKRIIFYLEKPTFFMKVTALSQGLIETKWSLVKLIKTKQTLGLCEGLTVSYSSWRSG